MSTEESRPQLTRTPSYPFLFSLYPVLHLCTHNIREISLTQALWASAAALGVAFALWLLTRLFSARPEKRALLLFLFLLLFHSYGLYYEQIAGLLPEGLSPLAAHALAVLFPATAWALVAAFLVRSRSSLSSCNRILSIATWILLGWNIAGILIYSGSSLANSLKKNQTPNLPFQVAVGSIPDIYCIILDEFAAPESVQRLFGMDASLFTESLRQRNFFVATESKARFVNTEPAIADILNLGKFPEKDNPAAAVRRSTVVGFLKRQGYRIIDFASEKHLFLDAADQRFLYDLSHASIFFDEFYRTLFERSLLRILPDTWRDRETNLIPFHRQRILQVFEELPAVVKERGPKFVFIHLLSPHEPFVFTAEGNATDPGHIWNHSDPRRYLGQYKYISRRILETVDMILERSLHPPVILLQSDHGYRGSRRPGNRVPRAEMVSVLNAIYLPEVDPGTVDPSLSPRSNFRLVFNLYFGADYTLLPID